MANAGLPIWRPATRGDCAHVARPCVWTSCRYHLEADQKIPAGRNGPKLKGKPYPEAASCALDVADDGAHTLAEVATELGVTRERVRQIEVDGLRKVKRRVDPEAYELLLSIAQRLGG